MRCRLFFEAVVSPRRPRDRQPFSALGAVLCLFALGALTACGGHPPRQATHYSPSRYYPPPGSASDPWGPYVHEASGRFGVPELWIRKVMRQESGGQEDVISWAGAMGLMQVMPDTYDGLRQRYNLGGDPFDPHDNILAGTAYLREMYDRYGSPAFLAAYNAGPNRLDRYLNNGTPLPDETVNYVASIAPLLGPGTPMSGPLAVYAGNRGGVVLAARRSSGACDPDAAYDPSRPCAPAQTFVQNATPQAPVQTVAMASAATSAAATSAAATSFGATRPLAFPSGTPVGCDTDAAYDPARPCQPLPPITDTPAAAAAPQPTYTNVSYSPPASAPSAYVPAAYAPAVACDPDAAYDPTRRCRAAPVAAVPVVPVVQRPAAPRRPLQEMQAIADPPPPAPHPSGGNWGIQVGAYANLSMAEAAAEGARSAAPDLLRMAKIELPATNPFGTQVAFRARLIGLTQTSASTACSRLSNRGVPCLTVSPSRTF